MSRLKEVQRPRNTNVFTLEETSHDPIYKNRFAHFTRARHLRRCNPRGRGGWLGLRSQRLRFVLLHHLPPVLRLLLCTASLPIDLLSKLRSLRVWWVLQRLLFKLPHLLRLWIPWLQLVLPDQLHRRLRRRILWMVIKFRLIAFLNRADWGIPQSAFLIDKSILQVAYPSASQSVDQPICNKCNRFSLKTVGGLSAGNTTRTLHCTRIPNDDSPNSCSSHFFCS